MIPSGPTHRVVRPLTDPFTSHHTPQMQSAAGSTGPATMSRRSSPAPDQQHPDRIDDDDESIDLGCYGIIPPPFPFAEFADFFRHDAPSSGGAAGAPASSARLQSAGSTGPATMSRPADRASAPSPGPRPVSLAARLAARLADHCPCLVCRAAASLGLAGSTAASVQHGRPEHVPSGVCGEPHVRDVVFPRCVPLTSTNRSC